MEDLFSLDKYTPEQLRAASTYLRALPQERHKLSEPSTINYDLSDFGGDYEQPQTPIASVVNPALRGFNEVSDTLGSGAESLWHLLMGKETGPDKSSGLLMLAAPGMGASLKQITGAVPGVLSRASGSLSALSPLAAKIVGVLGNERGSVGPPAGGVPKPIPHPELIELLRRARGGDSAAREELITKLMGSARRAARAFRDVWEAPEASVGYTDMPRTERPMPEYGDLLGEAMTALVRAVDKANPDVLANPADPRNIKSYIFHSVRNKLQTATGKQLHGVSDETNTGLLRFRKEYETFIKTHGGNVPDDEQMLELLSTYRNRKGEQLYGPEQLQTFKTLYQKTFAPFEDYENSRALATGGEVFKGLTPDQRTMLEGVLSDPNHELWGKSKNQRDILFRRLGLGEYADDPLRDERSIAAELNLDPGNVHRQLEQAIKKLRRFMEQKQILKHDLTDIYEARTSAMPKHTPVEDE